LTCIVGIADGKHVWMGGDTALSSYSQIGTYKHSKVFIKTTDVRHGDNPELVIIGGCGSLRLLQLLEHGVIIPRIGPVQDVVQWLTIEFADSVRQLLKDKGYIHNDKPEEFGNSSFLIGIRGLLYHMESNFQCIAYGCQEDAAGSGSEYALGSLHTTRKKKGAPRLRITAALEAAAEYNPHVLQPFDILSI
jgi:hypothetical protein